MIDNTRFKSYCRQKEISFIENSTKEKSHLCKKDHLNRTGKTFCQKFD